MRTSDILLVLGALASSSLSCASKTSDATEVPARPPWDGADASCRHELGRCGGHTPGDGACGGASESAGPASPLEDVAVEPGKIAEINLEMSKGAIAEIEFVGVGGPLEWNVHSHDGDNVVIHAEGTGADGKVKFAAPRAGGFSYLWKNAGATVVRLTTRLSSTGTVRVHSVHPAP
jgi:hypothetical protein